MTKNLLDKYPNQGFYSVYSYVDARKEWVGLLIERKGDQIINHTIGCEQTENAIKVWCDGAMKAFKEGKGAADEPPDMYQRSTLN